jgi:hypothetical protein
VRTGSSHAVAVFGLTLLFGHLVLVKLTAVGVFALDDTVHGVPRCASELRKKSQVETRCK